MKRELLDHKQGKMVSGCCPSHDKWPDETYANRKSIKARSRDKQKEHQLVRTLSKRETFEEKELRANAFLGVGPSW